MTKKTLVQINAQEFINPQSISGVHLVDLRELSAKIGEALGTGFAIAFLVDARQLMSAPFDTRDQALEFLDDWFDVQCIAEFELPKTSSLVLPEAKKPLIL